MRPVITAPLPSKGYPYKDTPWSSGDVQLHPMRVAEWKNVASRRKQKDDPDTIMLRSCVILEEGCDLDQLLLSDRAFLLVQIRISSWGKNKEIEVRCPTCSKIVRDTVDLTQLEITEADPEWSEYFEHTLPNSGEVVTLKLLRGHDRKLITAMTEKSNDQETEALTAQIFYSVAKVNGKELSVPEKLDWVNNLIIGDMYDISSTVNKKDSGVILSWNVDCNCGEEIAINLTSKEHHFLGV